MVDGVLKSPLSGGQYGSESISVNGLLCCFDKWTFLQNNFKNFVPHFIKRLGYVHEYYSGIEAVVRSCIIWVLNPKFKLFIQAIPCMTYSKVGRRLLGRLFWGNAKFWSYQVQRQSFLEFQNLFVNAFGLFLVLSRLDETGLWLKLRRTADSTV